MSNAEHAIENMLVALEQGKTSEEIKAAALTDPNFHHISMSVRECWEIAQYVYYTYLPLAKGD